MNTTTTVIRQHRIVPRCLGQCLSSVLTITERCVNHQTNSNEYSNRSIAELLGYTPAEVIEMGDAFFERVIHPDDLPRIPAHFGALAAMPDGAYAAWEYRGHTKDGDTVWLRSIDAVFERAEDGSVLRHIGIALDITVEKEATERLQRVTEELWRQTAAAHA